MTLIFGEAGANTTEEIAHVWRTLVEVDCTWVRAQNQAGAARGISCGAMACCPEAPARRVYIKPMDAQPGVAAREKIASDLAYDLGVRVPPTLLSRFQEGGREHLVCVSLVMYPLQYSWHTIDPARGFFLHQLGGALNGLPTAAAQGLAFDTWVDQIDHDNPENHNIILGYHPHALEEAQIIYLDYALAFGAFSMGGFERNIGRLAPFPRYMLNRLDRAAPETSVSRIEATGDDSIEEVVNRIPEGFMARDEKAMIIEGLKGRRAQLRLALSPTLHGGSS